MPGTRTPLAVHVPDGIASYGVGTVLALVAAALFAVGSVLQHEVASGLGEGKLSLKGLLRRKRWVIGQAATLAAAVLQLVALALAPVAIVQPLIAASLVVALGVRALLDRRAPSRVEYLAVAATAAGLAVFLVAAQPAEGGHGTVPGIASVLAVVLPTVGLVALAPLAGRGRYGALACGSAAGLSLAVAAVLSAAALRVWSADGFVHMLTTPVCWGAVVTAVAAAIGSQQAYARGNLAWSLPALTVIDPLLAIPVARVLLGERLRPGHALVWAPAAVAAAVGVVVLATHVRADHGPTVIAAPPDPEVEPAS